MTALWIAVIIAALGTYLLKLAGMSLPESVLNHPTVRRVAHYLPIAMLAALVTVQLSDGGGHWAINWRTLVAVAAAIVMLLLKRGFLTVFLTAIVVCALLQLVPGP